MSSESSSATWTAARKKNCEKASRTCRGWSNTQEAFCPGARRVETVGRQKIVWQEAYTRISIIRRESAGETNKLGVRLEVRNNSAECFAETAEGVFRAREVRRIQHQDRWDKEAINNVIGVLRRIVDGKWTVDRAVTRSGTLPPPPVPFEGARVQGERITRTDTETVGTTAGCPGCNAIKSGKRAQAHLQPCGARIETCLKTTPEGAERLDRRSEVLNEALAKERKYSRRDGSPTGVEGHGDPTLVRSEKEPCNESGSSSQMESSRAVAETPTQQHSMADGSSMAVEGEQR